MLIYCVDDDQSILELITYTLNQTGFETEGFENGRLLFEALAVKIPDLIILDIMLADLSGLDILQKIREDEKTAGIPIIMATAKGTEYDKVSGLDAGADDYLVKPFGMMELVSRVRALLRRMDKTGQYKVKKLIYKDIKVDRKKHLVFLEEQPLNLTMKEFQLLEILVENQGVALSRDLLLNKIWGYDFDGETRTVDVHIRSLRKKLGTVGEHIKTVHGMGYRLDNN